MKKTLAVLAGVVALPLLAGAEQPFTLTETVVVNARIDVIDHDARELTLVDAGGGTATVRFGPEIDSFDRLTVGDTATFRYYESVAYAIRKPGQPSVLPSTTDEPVVARGQGPNPAVTLSRQQTARLTIVSVDPRGPSVTVLTQDGRRLSFRPFQQADVARLEIGDQMDVTYTQALVISVLPSTALPHELATTAARPVTP